MTPEQRRRNRRTGIALAIIAIALFVWGFIKVGGFL